MKTIFIVGLHGDEQVPINVIKRHFKNKIDYLIVNKEAVKNNVRFIRTDLNRSFPGDIKGSYEERIADKLLNKLVKYEMVIDLHTSTCDTLSFIILTKITANHLVVVQSLGINKIVYMQKSIASGKALIDYVPTGISVECGHENSPETSKNIKKMLDYYLIGEYQKIDVEYYTVFNILKKSNNVKSLPKEVQSFKLTEIGGEKFYPVLARETNYPGVLCLMAKKVSLRKFLMLEK